MNVKNVTMILIVGIIIVLSAQNTQPATITFFFWEFSIPLIILIYILLIMGFLLGYLYTSIRQIRKKRKVTREEVGVAEDDDIIPQKPKKKRKFLR
jgi:uncharacterized integral membrane protein